MGRFREKKRAARQEEALALSRRSFLAGIASAVTVGLPGRAAGRERVPHSREFAEPTPVKLSEANWTLWQQIEEFADAQVNTAEGSLDLATRDEARAEFVHRFAAALPELLTELADQDALTELYDRLASVDSHGLIYQFLHERGAYRRWIGQVDTAVIQGEHYRARAADFLPTGREVLDREIDPRLTTVGIRGLQREPLAAIQTYPGWTSARLRHAFRTAIDDPAIREPLQATNCSLAEAYSVVKALVKSERAAAAATDGDRSERVATLLRARERFLTTDVLGPETDQFITFHYNEPQWLRAAAVWRETAERCLIPPERITTVQPGPGEKAEPALATSLRQSSGATTVLLDTHGGIDGQSLAVREGSREVIALEAIAQALVDRIGNSADPHELGRTRLIFTSCYSYEFAENLREAMEKAYRRLGKTRSDLPPFAQVDLPLVVAAANEGSPAHASTFVLGLRENATQIARDQRLTGAVISRAIQPSAYELADITVFEGTAGAWTEIGWTAPELADDKTETA
jgi:hypothetical protein